VFLNLLKIGFSRLIFELRFMNLQKQVHGSYGSANKKLKITVVAKIMNINKPWF